MNEIKNFSPIPEESAEAYPRIILDVHTHHPAPQPEGILALDPADLPAEGAYPSQFYSVGLHPWSLQGISGASTERWALLEKASRRPDIVAVGETGIDTIHTAGAPIAGQLNAFRHHVDLSEEVGKPLIIHCVKSQDMILAVKRDMRPAQPWIIHGFRGKPGALQMLAQAGIYISFGMQFNPRTLLACPPDLILAETDESPVRIQDVIASLENVRSDVTPDLLSANMRRIFNLFR